MDWLMVDGFFVFCLCINYTGARVEEFVYEKVQGSKPQRMLENDVLGQHMIDAGNDFGPGTAYGQFPVFLDIVLGLLW